MAAAWQRHGGSSETQEMIDHDHFSIIWELNDRASPLARAVRAKT
jgi:hypothetical protein